MIYSTPITIRPAYGDDEAAIARLAALDSAERLPAKPLLVAEVGGELRAALSLSDGGSIADPFHHTLHIVTLLQMHATQLAARPAPARRRLGLRLRLA
jgi:hypothetical protein